MTMQLQPIHSARRFARTAGVATLACAALFLGACASKGPPPDAAMATARAALTQAEASGAGQLAPVELLAVRDKLAKAESAVRNEQYDQARRLADEATADAALAERKARAERARRAVTELQRSNAALQQEAAPRRQP